MIAIPPPHPRAKPRWRDRSRRIRYALPPVPATAYYYAVGLITGAAAASSAALLLR